MNSIRLFASAVAIIAGVHSMAECAIDVVFHSLYEEMGGVNVSESAFMGSVLTNRFCWLNQYRLSGGSLSDEAIAIWYTNLVHSTMPPMADFDATNRWLLVKSYAVSDMAFERAIRNSTNCWLAVANEHGRIRENVLSESDYNHLLGIDQCEKDILPDGVEIVSVPNLFSQERILLEESVRRMRQVQNRTEEVASSLRYAFKQFVRSETYQNMPVSELKVTVSNVIDIAKFTPLEIEQIGIMNYLNDEATR